MASFADEVVKECFRVGYCVRLVGLKDDACLNGKRGTVVRQAGIGRFGIRMHPSVRRDLISVKHANMMRCRWSEEVCCCVSKLDIPIDAVINIMLYVFHASELSTSFRVIDDIICTPPGSLRHANDSIKDLFEVLREAWFDQASYASNAGFRRKLGASSPLGEILSTFSRELWTSCDPALRQRSLPPVDFARCGSSIRNTSLRDKSDLDVNLIFDYSTELGPSIDTIIAEKLVHLAHRSLSCAARSAHAYNAGIRFINYIRHGSDVKGSGAKVAFRGYVLDCAIVVRGVWPNRVQAYLEQSERSQPPSLKAHAWRRRCSLVHTLLPSLRMNSINAEQPTESNPIVAKAARFVKMWRGVASELVTDSEDMFEEWWIDFDGAVETTNRFNPFPEDVVAKTPKGYSNADIEAAVRESFRLGNQSSVESLIVDTWRLLAYGWIPPSTDCVESLQVGITVQRIHCMMAEQLAAQATLKLHNKSDGCVLMTMRLLALMKLCDLDGARKSIEFDTSLIQDDDAVFEALDRQRADYRLEAFFNRLPFAAHQRQTSTRALMIRHRQAYMCRLKVLEKTKDICFWASCDLLHGFDLEASARIDCVRRELSKSCLLPLCIDEMRGSAGMGAFWRAHRMKALKSQTIGAGGFVRETLGFWCLMAALLKPSPTSEDGSLREAHVPIGTRANDTFHKALRDEGSWSFIDQTWLCLTSSWDEMAAYPESGTLGKVRLPDGFCNKECRDYKLNRIFACKHIHTETGDIIGPVRGVCGAFDEFLLLSVASYKHEVLDRVCFKQAASRLPDAFWHVFSACSESFRCSQQNSFTPPPCLCAHCRRAGHVVRCSKIDLESLGLQPSELEQAEVAVRKLQAMSCEDSSHSEDECRDVFFEDQDHVSIVKARVRIIAKLLYHIGGPPLLYKAVDAVPLYDQSLLKCAFRDLGYAV